jgi:hypothetical protein
MSDDNKMSKVDKVIEGLRILQPYYDKPGYDIGAEHDVIYGYSTNRPLSTEDQAKMRELGWFQDGVPYDENDNPGPYDPEEGWGTYV